MAHWTSQLRPGIRVPGMMARSAGAANKLNRTALTLSSEALYALHELVALLSAAAW